jgi:hypothetical protein
MRTPGALVRRRAERAGTLRPRLHVAGPIQRRRLRAESIQRRMPSLGLRRPLLTGSLLTLAAVLAFLGYHQTRPANANFYSLTNYLDARPPSGRATVQVASVRSLERALAHAHAGETILVKGKLRIAGEFTGFDRIINGGSVNVVLGPDVRFVGNPARGSPAVWVHGAAGWRIWGGTITNPGGVGLLFYSLPGPVTWTGFRVHDTASTCVSVLPVGGNIDRLELKGVTGTAKPNLSLDPHAENGTGIHAWNIADARGGLVERSTFAADVVDQATGASVEIDTGHIGRDVTVYARARHLGFAVPGTSWTGVARKQVAGNVIQLWGGTAKGMLDLRYIDGADIKGRLVDTTGVYPRADLSQVRVDQALVSGAILENRALSGPAVETVDGMRVAKRSQGLTSP